MRCRVPILLCVILLVCAPILGAASVAGQPQAEGTHLEAQLQDDGDAAWSVAFRVPIEDDDDRADFEAFAERFETGETELDLGVDAFERAAEEASTASDREMRIGSVRRESDVVTDSANVALATSANSGSRSSGNRSRDTARTGRCTSTTRSIRRTGRGCRGSARSRR